MSFNQENSAIKEKDNEVERPSRIKTIKEKDNQRERQSRERKTRTNIRCPVQSLHNVMSYVKTDKNWFLQYILILVLSAVSVFWAKIS